MSERSTGISTRNPTDYVATILASEQAEGHNRVIQQITVTAGKITTDSHSSSRDVSSDDSYDMSLVSGDVLIGDYGNLACYIQHTSLAGTCLVTPLLCDSGGDVIGHLPPKVSTVMLPVVSGSYYLSPCLTWSVMATGAWFLHAHVSNLSAGNTVKVDTYVF